MNTALQATVVIGLGYLLSGVCMGGTVQAQATRCDESGFLSTVDRKNREELFLVVPRSLRGRWSAAGFRLSAGDPASNHGKQQPHSSLLGCLSSPASLLVCLEAGVVSLGKVAARYTGKGKELVKLLQKWGGKVKPGGKGSHTKVRMPSGRVEIVPNSPGKGTVQKIIQRALAEAK